MASVNALRCQIGISLDEDCHIKSLCRNIGFYPISSFTEENKELLELRCELQFAEEDEVCYHHEKAYLSSLFVKDFKKNVLTLTNSTLRSKSKVSQG